MLAFSKHSGPRVLLQNNTRCQPPMLDGSAGTLKDACVKDLEDGPVVMLEGINLDGERLGEGSERNTDSKMSRKPNTNKKYNCCSRFQKEIHPRTRSSLSQALAQEVSNSRECFGSPLARCRANEQCLCIGPPPSLTLFVLTGKQRDGSRRPAFRDSLSTIYDLCFLDQTMEASTL